jgi:hypothetical protein
MLGGGVALICGYGGLQRLRQPSYCGDPDCQQKRDEAAIARAVAAGVINPHSAEADQ